MKKLPSGVSDFEKLVIDNYYYVDKTTFIEKIENYPNPNIMFLRPRKFGKTLFTTTLENYYDIKKADKFNALFSETYIGKNPTKLKNNYYILKFNFSGIDTTTIETTIRGFKEEVISSIDMFSQKYNLNFDINLSDDAERILDKAFKAFNSQKQNSKIYVIIDEYDHFANELLGFNANGFKDLISKNGKVRKWYEILKKGTESVVDRIFITGVAPITLDGMTSGFNIVSDITRDRDFNEMMGFTEKELIELMNHQKISKEEQEKLLPLMKENYDGYKFTVKAEQKIYNSNMTLYFLNEYIRYRELPERMVDVNIASDYTKIGNMLKLCKGEKRLEILGKTLSSEGVLSEITEKFNPAVDFGDNEMSSMLYYLGYLTISESVGAYARLVIPNKMMREIYADYFLKVIQEENNLNIDVEYAPIAMEALKEGNIDKVIDILRQYLTGLSNRDYQGFDEKYVKVMFYTIVKNLKAVYYIKSELEIEKRYPDLLLIPRDIGRGYYALMLEFKYLKKKDANKLEEKRKEAKEQITEYANFEEIKNIPNLRKYTIIAVNNEVYVDEIH